MTLDLQYVDPRLVALYDLENSRGADTDFYVGLAADLNARTIVDLGCGTGLLTRELAVDGRQVIGVDPAEAMLDAARRHPGAERVEWVVGAATAIGNRDADLLVMTGNVAQVFLEDEDWAATLRAIHGALRPGGYLSFESRNTEARAWEQWTRAATFERFDSPNGPMESWLELVSVQPGQVLFEGHNVFLNTGAELVVPSTLRFRNQAELTRSLVEQGFSIEHLYGDWQQGPVGPNSRVLIFVARRP